MKTPEQRLAELGWRLPPPLALSAADADAGALPAIHVPASSVTALVVHPRTSRR